MIKAGKFREHVRHILDAIEHGSFKSNRYTLSLEDTDMNHSHTLAYEFLDNNLCPRYSYIPEMHDINADKNKFRLDIKSTYYFYYDKPSYIRMMPGGTMVFLFNPNTMDDIKIHLVPVDKNIETIELKDFLTEGQYFMYNTIYDLPEYEEIELLLVYMQWFRGEILRKKLVISGVISDDVPDIGSYAFNQHVGYSS